MVTSKMLKLLLLYALATSFELCALGCKTHLSRLSPFSSYTQLAAYFCNTTVPRYLTNITVLGEAYDDDPDYEYIHPNGTFYTLPKGALAKNMQLDNLYFPRLQAFYVPQDVFSPYPNVQHLLLPDSTLKALPVGVFDPIRMLREVNLDYSHLVTLPDGIFAQNKLLERVSLKGTFIGELPSQLFNGIQEVDFSEATIKLDRALCAVFNVSRVFGKEVNSEKIQNLTAEANCSKNRKTLCHSFPGQDDKLYCECPARETYNGTHCGPPCLYGVVSPGCVCRHDLVMSSDGRSCFSNKCIKNCNSEGQVCWLTKDEPGYVCDCHQSYFRANASSRTCHDIDGHCGRKQVHRFFNRATRRCSCRPGYGGVDRISYKCRAGVAGIVGDFSCNISKNPVYLFLPARLNPSSKNSVGLTSSIDEAIQQCVEKGGDIPHHMEGNSCQAALKEFSIPQKHINNGYFHRDGVLLGQNPEGQQKVILCQRPVHHCSQYGVLAVPKNINFNATFDLATAEHECKELGFTLPIRTAPGVETCVKDFQNRMMELFQMKLRPLIWWQGDIGGYRHLVCLAPIQAPRHPKITITASTTTIDGTGSVSKPHTTKIETPPNSNVSKVIYIRHWNPSSNLTLEITCATDLDVNPAPQFEVISSSGNLNKLDSSSLNFESHHLLKFVSTTGTLPDTYVSCSATNKAGNASSTVLLKSGDTLYNLGEPRSHYVGAYGEPIDFTCSSSTQRHSVMCQAVRVVPQNVRPWAFSCLDRTQYYNVQRKFRIKPLVEKYAGHYYCVLSRYSFYTPPPSDRDKIFFSIAIKESAPQTASLNIEVIDEEAIPGQLSPHQVITVAGPYPNTSTIFVMNWSPAKNLNFNISCATEKTVYPAPQMSLESLQVDLTSLDISLHRGRTVNHAELVSGVHIVPGDQLRCSASNKMGGSASTVLVKSGADLEVFPYDRTIATHNGKRNESYIFHVYGAPLTWLNACLKSVGRKKWCSGRKEAMQNFTTSVLKNESIEVMLSWTHGHVERGNVFGKVIWSISLDESQDLLESLPNVSCQIKIYDSFARDRTDFMMHLHDVLSANKEDYQLPMEDIAIDGSATTTTTTATTAVSTAVSIRTNKEDIGEDFRTGEELRLECIVEGSRRRTPNVRWVFNNATALVHGTLGVSIPRITADKGVYRSTVTIQQAGKQHGGIYWCIVRFGGPREVRSKAVHLRHQDTLFYLEEPRSHNVGVYGEPFNFSCRSIKLTYNVMCKATKVVPQNVQPWALTCLDSVRFPTSQKNFRIATLNEKHAGQYRCTLSRYNFYTPPPEDKADIFFSIAIKESAPQTASLNIEVIDEEAIPGQLSPHQVITVAGPYPNTSTIFVKNWSPAKKLTFNISCATEKTVYPAPQMSLESLRVDLTSLDISLQRGRTVNHAELVSGVHIDPEDQFRCSASNKMGGSASTVLVKSGADLEVFPYNRTVATHNGKRNESYIFHVYGAPLTWLNACLKSKGWGGWCSGRKEAMQNFTTSVLKNESIEVMLSWTHGHVERGNVFGKVIWSISLDESQDLLESLPNVSCQIKIYDSFARDGTDFMMHLHDVLSANKEDYHLPMEDIAIDGTATNTTTTATTTTTTPPTPPTTTAATTTTAVSTAVSIRTNKEDVGEDFRTGDELSLECMVEGRSRPTPDIGWVFNNTRALVNGTFGVSIARITTDKGDYRSTVTIQQAGKQHGGIYWCTVGFGEQTEVRSKAVHLRHQDTLYKLGEPRSHYVGVYGEPFDFTCSSLTKRHNVKCQATKVLPQNVQPWAFSCLDDKKTFNIEREFRIATLNEKYDGEYYCTLSRYSFYVPPPMNRINIFFSIAIKESAPQTASLNIEVVDEEAIPGQLSPHQVITVAGPYPNTSTIFVKNWSPAKKLTFNISCATEKTVYPAPQMSLESLRVDLTSLDISLHRGRTVNHAELVSGVHIVPEDQFRCSASNKMGGSASTVLVKSGVEPIAIPMVQEADENETQTSTSFTSHVYGMPLGKMYACIKVKGFSKRRDCTQDFMPADDVTVAIGDFDNSTAYFTWSYGHTDRGNLFGKATWTLSGDSSEEHFQLASFTLRILNPYNGGKPKKFVFKTKNVQLISAAAKNDLVADQRGWPELSSLVTAKPHV